MVCLPAYIKWRYPNGSLSEICVEIHINSVVYGHGDDG